MRNMFFLALILAFVSQGCTVEKATDDTTNDSDSSDTDSAGQDTDSNTENDGDLHVPTGIDLEQEQGTDEGFPEHAYDDGPELDDTRASLRAIQEADIVQIVGDRLYAISKASGLAIIDVSVQDTLTLLGRFRTEATPFEMYVRGDRVIGLFKNAPIIDENGEQTGITSRVIALNVADPAAITIQSTFDIAGEITDSRIIDSILFVASHERGDEWNEIDPVTTVVSLNVSDVANIVEVDRLSFNEVQLTWSNDQGWSQKSVTTSDDRLYISGPVSEENSSIQVVDISDTTGNMELGASVEVAGAIFSRWQIDEYEGILRVISQPPDSSYQEPPVVQTFTINSSQDIVPLGSLTLVLPRPELLRSARFDEDKAYVITFQRIDPLFTIDLTDPANPVQVGELEVPGFVFHLEPKGDRLLGLGFEPGNSEGGLHVSLFDVSDLTTPTQLARVNFGPTWSSISSFDEDDFAALVEDRNRIHKLFKVLDDLGLIMVPFSGWDDEHVGCGNFQSGVQLVDFTTDTLTKRGLIGATGTARRAFIHNERMFTFSEEQLQVFNIEDRDAPQRTANMPLALRVHRTAPFGDKVVRISSNWFARNAYADVVNLTDVETNELGGTIDLAALLNENPESCEYHNDAPFANAPLFAFGDHLAIPVVHQMAGEEYYVTDLIVIDTSGDTPALAAQLRLDFEPINTGLGSGIVQMENALVFQRPGDTLNEAQDMQDVVVEIVDMTTPAAPQLITDSLIRPFAAGTTGLHVVENQISSGYFAFDEEGYVDYYLDRIDFTDPAAPSALDPISFPGLLLGPLAVTDYLSVDFVWTFQAAQPEDECVAAGGEFDEPQNVCWYVNREMQRINITDNTATATASVGLDNDIRLSAVLLGNERYFLPAIDGNWDPIVVVVGTNGAELASSNVDLSWGDSILSPLVHNEKFYFVTGSSLREINAENAAQATISTISYPGGGRSVHLAMTGNTAIISCGDSGVSTVQVQ